MLVGEFDNDRVIEAFCSKQWTPALLAEGRKKEC